MGGMYGGGGWDMSGGQGFGGFGKGGGKNGGKATKKVCYSWRDTGSCANGDSCPFAHEGNGGGVQKLTGTGEKKDVVPSGRVVDYVDAENKGGSSLTVWEESYVVKQLTLETKDNEGRDRLKWRCGFVPPTIFRESLDLMCLIHPTAKDKDGVEIGTAKSAELVKELTKLLKDKGLTAVQLEGLTDKEEVKSEMSELKDIVKVLAENQLKQSKDNAEAMRATKEETKQIKGLLTSSALRGQPMTPTDQRPRKARGARASLGASSSSSSSMFGPGPNPFMSNGRRVPSAGMASSAASSSVSGGPRPISRESLAGNLFPEGDGSEIPVEEESSDEEILGDAAGMPGGVPNMPEMAPGGGNPAAAGGAGGGGGAPPPQLDPLQNLPNEEAGWNAVAHVEQAFNEAMKSYKQVAPRNQHVLDLANPTAAPFDVLLPRVPLIDGFTTVQATPAQMGVLAMMVTPVDVESAATTVLPHLLQVIKLSAKPVKRVQILLNAHGLDLTGGVTFKRGIIALCLAVAKDLRLFKAQNPGAGSP